MFLKTKTTFGDFRVHRAGAAWGRRKGWQQGPSLGRGKEDGEKEQTALLQTWRG